MHVVTRSEYNLNINVIISAKITEEGEVAVNDALVERIFASIVDSAAREGLDDASRGLLFSKIQDRIQMELMNDNRLAAVTA